MPRKKIAIEFGQQDWELFVLYQAGFSLKEISEKTKLSYEMIKKRCERGKWPKIMDSMEAARKKKNPKSKSPLAKVFAQDGRDVIVKRFNERREKIADKVSEHVEKLPAKDIIFDAPKIDAAMKMSERALGLDREEESERGHISLTFLTGNSADMVKVIEHPKVKEIEDGD